MGSIERGLSGLSGLKSFFYNLQGDRLICENHENPNNLRSIIRATANYKLI
jgi:hypothetical protein